MKKTVVFKQINDGSQREINVRSKNEKNMIKMEGKTSSSFYIFNITL